MYGRRQLFAVVLFVVRTRASASYSLAWKTLVGCEIWGPGCWVPGFTGTDSSPSFFAQNATDDALVIGSYDSNLYGLRTADGGILFKAGGSGGEGSPTVVQSQNTVISWGVLTGSTLDCLDKDTGAVRWQWTPPCKGPIVTSGPFDDGVVYAGTSSTHKFYAVNASNGATVWSADTEGEMWGTLGACVVKEKNMVCVGAGGNAIQSLNEKARVVCLNRSTGEIVWASRTGKQIQSRPSYFGDLLFIGDYDGCLYALELATGAPAWKTCTGEIIEGSSLVVSGNLVVFPSYDGAIHAVDTNSGASVWNTTLGSSPIASTPRLSNLDGSTIYAGGQTGLYALDIMNGTILWKFATDKLVGSSPALSTDESMLAFGCEDGFLYLLRRN